MSDSTISLSDSDQNARLADHEARLNSLEKTMDKVTESQERTSENIAGLVKSSEWQTKIIWAIFAVMLLSAASTIMDKVF